MDIGGATSITYTLVTADVGTVISVRQTETNVAGSANATSADTATIAAAFTPANVFASSEKGLWGAVTASKLWQDVARTTAVTADGQTVASWELNTASGVIYAEQATAGSRPTYRESGGVEWLEFDGTTDFLSTPGVTTDASYQVFARVRPATVTGVRSIIDSHQTSPLPAGVRSQYLRINGANPQTISFNAAGLGATTDTGPAVTISTDVTLAAIAISGTSLDLRTDGASNGVTSNANALNNPTVPVTFGRNGASGTGDGGQAYFSGRLYGAIVRLAATNLTSGEIADCTTWTDNLSNP